MVYGLLLVELFLEKEDKGDCFPGSGADCRCRYGARRGKCGKTG